MDSAYLEGYEILARFKVKRLYANCNHLRLKKLLDYIVGSDEDVDLSVIHCMMFKGSFGNTMIHNTSSLYFSHKPETGVEHFKKYINHFSISPTNIEIYYDKENKFRVVIHIENLYFDEKITYIFDIYLVNENIFNNNTTLYKLYDRQLKLEKEYGEDNLKKVSSILKPLNTDGRNNGYYQELEVLKEYKLGKESIKPIDFFNLNYHIIKKDSYCEYIPKEFNKTVIDLVINSNFKITNEQANCLNHTIGTGLYLYNHDLAKMYYTCKERAYYDDREWVYKQLKPFIKKGLVVFSKIKRLQDKRYTDWVFYENTPNMVTKMTNLLNLTTINI